MTEAVSVDHEGGVPYVTKRAARPDHARRVRVEIAALEQARHPGVVAVQSADTADALPWFTAAWGGESLAGLGPPGPDRGVALVRALAATIADIHALGVAHGRITADHVLVGPGDRPVLCGFAEAQRFDADSEVDACMRDVRALAALLRWTCGDASPGLRRSGRTARAARALAARFEDDERGPASARAFLTAMARLRTADPVPAGPGATDTAKTPVADRRPRRPGGPERATPSPERWSRPASVSLVAGALLVALGAAWAGGAILRRPERPALPGSEGPTLAAAPAASDDTTAPPARRCPLGTADTAGDGTCRPFTTGNHEGTLVVEVDGARWALGDTGDEVALGDWDCDGTATPALLRPGTGDVFVFAAWADDAAVVEATERVPGARNPHPDPQRCGRMRVVVDGTVVDVDTRPEAS